VIFPNYSSGNAKTNSIWPVSVCLAFFNAIWYYFTSGLAFFVHLDLATLVRTIAVEVRKILTTTISYFLVKMIKLGL